MARFAVQSDASRKLICVQLLGLLDLDDVAALKIAQADEVKSRRYLPRQFDAIIDVVECPIQPQEVAMALQALSHDPDFQPRRIGFVVGQSAVKLQVRRMEGGPNTCLCASRGEAESWFADTPTDCA